MWVASICPSILNVRHILLTPLIVLAHLSWVQSPRCISTIGQVLLFKLNALYFLKYAKLNSRCPNTRLALAALRGVNLLSTFT